MQSDAFSDNKACTKSQPVESSDDIACHVPKWVRDAGDFKRFFTGGKKRLKGQDVRVTGGIPFGRDSEQRLRPPDRIYE